MSATARAATSRPSTARRRPTPVRTTSRRRPALVEVPQARAAVAGNGVFALVVLGMLVTGMGVLLVLNTTLAQGAFEISALTSAQHKLAVSEQLLLQQVALAESPESLQGRADALGMVPVASPVFLRLADGAVLGTPVAAKAGPRTSAGSSLPSTGGVAPATAGTTASKPAPTAPTAKPATGDAAVADPAPQTDAAVADTTRTATSR